MICVKFDNEQTGPKRRKAGLGQTFEMIFKKQFLGIFE